MSTSLRLGDTPVGQTPRRRITVIAAIGLGAAIALVAAVLLSWAGDTEMPVVEQGEAVLVANDAAFCRDLTTITMSERIATPSLYSRIVPSEVPEEHFAEDAWAIATAIPSDFEKAVELAVAYDADVRIQCEKGEA